MQILADLLSLSSKFVMLFSAYSKPLFIDPTTHIYLPLKYCNMSCNVHKVACPSYFIAHTPSYTMPRCIENLNSLCIVLYLLFPLRTYVMLGSIIKLLTSVGVAQARPRRVVKIIYSYTINIHTMFLYLIIEELRMCSMYQMHSKHQPVSLYKK